MRIAPLFWLLFLFTYAVSAQQFGANPPSLKWQQVNTPDVRIIFPRGLDSTAQRIAGIVDYLNKHTGITAGTAHRKISIVLQNQNTSSNGYVGLAPWRSEFYLTPPLNSFELGSLPWAATLALHEYRHVQQYMNYRKGLSKLAYLVLGEEGQAIANNAAIPDWFFEGDAVFQETAVSGQGRGRLPYFFNPYRALWQAGRKFSYMKLRNGSLRQFIPNHYALGYLLTSYGREKYGAQFWNAITDEAVQFKGLFYPFQKAILRHTGLPYSQFVDSALHFCRDQTVFPASDSFITSGSSRYVTDYLLPQFTDDDKLLVLKKSYRDLSAWWMITGEGEKKIRDKDIGQEDYYDYANGKIVYTAYEPDALYSRREYNVIKLLDVKTSKVIQLTHKSKYFQPGLSKDASRVIAVQYTPDQKVELHVLDAATGTVLHKVPQSQGGSLVYTCPVFYDASHAISCVRNAEGLMTIAKINLSTGVFENLLPWTSEVMGGLELKGDTLYFSGANGYQDNIFAVHLPDKKVFQLTNTALGAYNPAVSTTGWLVWSSFTANGMQLATKRLNAADWQPVTRNAALNAPDLYLPRALQQTGGNVLNEIGLGKYPVSKYKKMTNPINIHSWRPYYEQPEWRFTLYGQNVLNTLETQWNYTYNENEGSHSTGFNGLYGGWFPWLSGGLSYTLNRKIRDSSKTIRWNETNAHIGLLAPFDFTRGRWYRKLSVASSFHAGHLQVTGRYKDSVSGVQFQYVQFSANWRSQTQQAVQHINPRWAQRFGVSYRRMVNGYRAEQWLLSALLSFPGISVNHSLVLSGAFQARDTSNQYRFSNNFPFARGYNSADAPRMWKGSVNYHFPLFYPDWGFGQLLYFLRIRSNLFFDYAQAKNLRTGEIFSFRSCGAELYFDTKWWNQQPVSFGVRYSHIFDQQVFGAGRTGLWEFILPVNLLTR